MYQAESSLPFRHAIVFVLLVSTAAYAVPIGDIDVGDRYYVNNVLRDNDLVVVRRVDTERNMVKVQFAGGAVDWVRPSELYTRTAARQADVEEAVVGTAVVAGVLWAILDPDGFEKAMSSSNSNQSRQPRVAPKPRPEPQRPAVNPKDVIALDAVPFAPVVEGQWTVGGEKWVTWANALLADRIGAEARASIGYVRLKELPFYRETGHTVYLAELVRKDRGGAYYALAPAGQPMSKAQLLANTGTPIHTLNKELGLKLQSDALAKEYLKFFASGISGQDGVFIVTEPGDGFIPGELLAKSNSRPMTISRRSDRSWEVNADVFYNNCLSRATFLVRPDGNVEMIQDAPRAWIEPKLQVRIDGSRRVYVGSKQSSN